MRANRLQVAVIHMVLLGFAAMTLLPFAFAVNNVFRTNREFYQSFFSVPEAFQGLAVVGGRYVTGNKEPMTVIDELGGASTVSRREAAGHYAGMAKRGPAHGLGGPAAAIWSIPCLFRS